MNYPFKVGDFVLDRNTNKLEQINRISFDENIRVIFESGNFTYDFDNLEKANWNTKLIRIEDAEQELADLYDVDDVKIIY